MATQEQTGKVFEKIREVKTNLFFKNINSINAGAIFVMGYLYEVEKESYASSLCEIMKISRARMSVLLEKLIQKGYIIKKCSSEDARKESVSLTHLGKIQVESTQENVKKDISTLIDNIGFEKLLDFIETAEKINNIMKEYKGEENV